VPLHGEVRQALSAYEEVRRKIKGTGHHIFVPRRTKGGVTSRAVERLVAKYV